jgi:hypothetical protein
LIDIFSGGNKKTSSENEEVVTSQTSLSSSRIRVAYVATPAAGIGTDISDQHAAVRCLAAVC